MRRSDILCDSTIFKIYFLVQSSTTQHVWHNQVPRFISPAPSKATVPKTLHQQKNEGPSMKSLESADGLERFNQDRLSRSTADGHAMAST